MWLFSVYWYRLQETLNWKFDFHMIHQVFLVHQFFSEKSSVILVPIYARFMWPITCLNHLSGMMSLGHVNLPGLKKHEVSWKQRYQEAGWNAQISQEGAREKEKEIGEREMKKTNDWRKERKGEKKKDRGVVHKEIRRKCEKIWKCLGCYKGRKCALILAIWHTNLFRFTIW